MILRVSCSTIELPAHEPLMVPRVDYFSSHRAVAKKPMLALETEYVSRVSALRARIYPQGTTRGEDNRFSRRADRAFDRLSVIDAVFPRFPWPHVAPVRCLPAQRRSRRLADDRHHRIVPRGSPDCAPWNPDSTDSNRWKP